MSKPSAGRAEWDCLGEKEKQWEKGQGSPFFSGASTSLKEYLAFEIVCRHNIKISPAGLSSR